MPAWGIVQTSPDEFSMYVSEHYGWPDNRLRRVTVRRHGFASVHADHAGGEFTTKPLIFSGDKLVLNYATSAAGNLQVEIQDESGKPLPGYALADMKPLYGDELDAPQLGSRRATYRASPASRCAFVSSCTTPTCFRFERQRSREASSQRHANPSDHMKTTAIKKLKQKLAAGETAFGMWVTLESPSITEMAVALGLDWIVIDAEHGQLDWQEIVAHMRCTVRSDTVALVRLTDHNIGLVKRALDIGADGVVIPWVETADQLRELVAFAHYPPTRHARHRRRAGYGLGSVHSAPHRRSERARSCRAHDRVGSRRAEHRRDGERGWRDAVSVGPADYSSSAGFAGQWQGPGIAEQLLEIKNTIAARRQVLRRDFDKRSESHRTPRSRLRA